jgi:hypothetical protein
MEYQITLSELLQHEKVLTLMGQITEQQIYQLWIKHDEVKVDLDELQYDFNSPISHKMVFRFRNAREELPCFWGGLDPMNRARLMGHFGLYKNVANIMEFFIWFLNHGFRSVSTNEFNMFDIECKKKSAICTFLDLDQKQQEKLIVAYDAFLASFQ